MLKTAETSMSDQDWTIGFFTGLIAESQRVIAGLSPTAAEAEFLVRELALKNGQSVLDVPCGNGRLSVALAAKGLQVSGVDLSSELLKDARAAGPNIKWNERDMRRLAGLGPFDAAFCFGNSFGYFDDSGNTEFLRSVASVLKPGGRFALETHFAAESVLCQPLGKRWYPFDGLLFLHDSNYDPKTGILTSDYILIKDGREERRQARYRVFFYRELVQWLADVGLAVRSAYGSLAGEPFRLGSSGLWVIAERKA
jgi:SAM-dependent methyltransferase